MAVVASLVLSGRYLTAVFPNVHDFPRPVVTFAALFIVVRHAIPRQRCAFAMLLTAVNLAIFLGIQGTYDTNFSPPESEHRRAGGPAIRSFVNSIDQTGLRRLDAAPKRPPVMERHRSREGFFRRTGKQPRANPEHARPNRFGGYNLGRTTTGAIPDASVRRASAIRTSATKPTACSKPRLTWRPQRRVFPSLERTRPFKMARTYEQCRHSRPAGFSPAQDPCLPFPAQRPLCLH